MLCTTPDGKIYAVDKPPPGCAVEKIEGAAPSDQSSTRRKPANVDPNSVEAGQIRAVGVCKERVLQRLRAPASATFLEPLAISHVGGWNFDISGAVDLLTRRIHFTCVARYTGGDQWNLQVSVPNAELPPDLRPTPSAAGQQRAAAAEVERRRSIAAVTIQNMEVRAYRNGHFFVGAVANGADFPVYGVQMCIQGGGRCAPIKPSTLFPGAQGTFSFEVLGWSAPSYRITWDVVPEGSNR